MYLWYRFPLWKIAELTVQRGQDLPTAIQYAIVFLTVFAVAAVAAAVTYVFVERPFLELRSRIYGRTHANRLDYPEMAVSRN